MERREEKRALISEEAAQWLVRLRDEKLGSAERRRYVGWLKQSPSHIAEMLRVSGLQDSLYSAKLQGSDVGSDVASNVVHLTGRAVPSRPRPGSWWRDGWLNWKFATGFSVLAVALLCGVLVNQFWSNQSIDTRVGEWRRVTLSDGSVVNVGPRSHLSFDFNDKLRSVYLTKGEALFQVAKNPNRPFIVTTDLAVVRAVGTQFGVTHRDGQVLVTVKEGKVAVTQGEVDHSAFDNNGSTKAPENAPVALGADEQITVSARTWPTKAQPVNATHELAWAQGQLIFDGTTTVAQAAEQFNRRNRIQIIVDPAIAGRLACCSFSIDDPESFAQSVATGSRNHAVELVREGTDILRLVPAEPRTSE